MKGKLWGKLSKQEARHHIPTRLSTIHNRIKHPIIKLSFFVQEEHRIAHKNQI